MRSFIAVIFTLLMIFVEARRIVTGISIDPTNPAGDPTVTQLLAIKTAWVRLEFIDATPPSQSVSASSMAFYRQKIQNFSDAGFRTLVILDYMTLQTVPWGGTASQWNTYITSFASRCREVAQGLSGALVHGGYEIWNEEDLTQTYVPPASYGLLLKAAYTAVKGTDPSATVVMGGLCSGDPSYISQVMASTNGQLYCDEVGLHPYGQRPYPDWPSSSWGFGYMGSLIASYIRVMPARMPVFITEFGTNDGAVQDFFPWMLFSGISVMPYNISAVVWFCWSDGMVGGFGLVTASGTPKPDYASYINYTTE